MEVTLRGKGRVTIPAPLREAAGLREGDKLEILIKRGAIILKPKQTVTADEIRGIIGPIEVHLEEIEEAPGSEVT